MIWPDDLDRFLDELGIDPMTPDMFHRERTRLERRFAEVYRLEPEMINAAILAGLMECDLVQEWIELMVFEAYVSEASA